MPGQKNQSDDLILLSRCASLTQIARQAGLDRKTAKRLALECGALLKIGDAPNSKFLIIKDVFWDSLCRNYRVLK